MYGYLYNYEVVDSRVGISLQLGNILLDPQSSARGTGSGLARAAIINTRVAGYIVSYLGCTGMLYEVHRKKMTSR